MPTLSSRRLWTTLAIFLVIGTVAPLGWGSGLGPPSSTFSEQSGTSPGGGIAPRYAVIDLGLLSTGYPIKITDSGYVLSTVTTGENGSATPYVTHAQVWSNGTSLTLQPAVSSTPRWDPTDIAQDGTVVGIEWAPSPPSVVYDYTSPPPPLYGNLPNLAVWSAGNAVPTLTQPPIIQGDAAYLENGFEESNIGNTSVNSNIAPSISPSSIWTTQVVGRTADPVSTIDGFSAARASGVGGQYTNQTELSKITSTVGSANNGAYVPGIYTGTAIFPLAANNSDQCLEERDSGYAPTISASSYTVPPYFAPSTTVYTVGGATLPAGLTPSGNKGALSNTNALNVCNVIVSGTQTACWDGTHIIPLPQPTEGSVLPTAVNAMTTTITIPGIGANPPTTQLVAATQVVGAGYIWNLVPSANATPAFGTPQLLDSLVSGYGSTTAPWAGISPTGINDSGAIVGTANYTPQGSNDPIAAGSHGVLLIPAELAVDADRNGTIVLSNENPSGHDANGNPVDATSQAKPFRFWLNNDQDSGTSNPNGSDVPASNTTTAVSLPDCQSNTIVSPRDLEDWTRLWIYTKGLNAAIHAGTLKVGLKWKNITRGTPGIKIVRATNTDGGLEYLGSLNSATLQISQSSSGGGKILQDANDSHTNIVPSSGSADFVFPTSTWTNLTDSAPKTFFLFEGTNGGQGQLEIVFLKSDGTTKIGEGGNLWLDLRDIKEMYLRAVANPQPPKPYSYVSSGPLTPSLSYFINSTGEGGDSGTFVADPNENTSNPTYIVFTHGFNQSDVSFTNYAETMYKRLWQLGYRGRFASYRWPTYGSGWGIGGATLSAAGIYNDCEYVAWNSGAPLRQFVQSLSASGYQIDVMSHSLGSVVVGEALREGMTVQYYSMCHAAASASLYDNGTSYYPLTSINPVSNTLDITPDTDAEPYTRTLAYSNYQGNPYAGYVGYLAHISGNVTGGSIVNFYDETDSAITFWWTANNTGFKPQPLYLGLGGGYFYYPNNNPGHKLILDGSIFYSPREVTDPSEAKSYSDQSLTGAVGSIATSQGVITSSGISEDAMKNDHSYEWNNALQDPTTFSFYNSLMRSYKFIPISIPTSP